METAIAITREAATGLRASLRKLRDRILNRAVDRLIDGFILAAVPLSLTAVVAALVIWGGRIADWFGASVEIKRWLVLAVAAIALATPLIGRAAISKVTRLRNRIAVNATITATPAVFDLSGVGYGKTTIVVRATDNQGLPARNAAAEIRAWSYTQSYHSAWSLRTDKNGAVVLTIDAHPSMVPGILVVRGFVLRENLLPLETEVDVTCVGSPAFLTLTAAPSKLMAGESATILATVTDAINQKVADTTRIHFASSTGQMTPEIAETFGGVAMCNLLTNSAGPCTIVATIRGQPGMPPVISQVTVQVVAVPYATPD